MAKFKVTFANGVAYVYDTEVNAHPTGYGDEHGVTHPVQSVEDVADDAETGFSGGPAKPAPVAAEA